MRLTRKRARKARTRKSRTFLLKTSRKSGKSGKAGKARTRKSRTFLLKSRGGEKIKAIYNKIKAKIGDVTGYTDNQLRKADAKEDIRIKAERDRRVLANNDAIIKYLADLHKKQQEKDARDRANDVVPYDYTKSTRVNQLIPREPRHGRTSGTFGSF